MGLCPVYWPRKRVQGAHSTHKSSLPDCRALCLRLGLMGTLKHFELQLLYEMCYINKVLRPCLGGGYVACSEHVVCVFRVVCVT